MSFTSGVRAKAGFLASFEDLNKLAANADYLQDISKTRFGSLSVGAAFDTINAATTAAVSWFSGDTDFWAGGNPTRLVIPSTYVWAKLFCALNFVNDAASAPQLNDGGLEIRKNGAAGKFGHFQVRNQASIIVQTPWLQVTGGDYFEFFVSGSTGGARNYFAYGRALVSK